MIERAKINVLILLILLGFVGILSRSFSLTQHTNEKPNPNPSNQATTTLNAQTLSETGNEEQTSDNQASTPSPTSLNNNDNGNGSRNGPGINSATSSAQQTRATARPQQYALLPNTQRGVIEDRNGLSLAYSQYLYNLYVDGRVKEPLNESSIKKIAELAQFSPDKLRTNLYNGRVTLLKRFAEKDKARFLYELRSPHFLTERVLHRTYPEGRLTAHTLGFVGHDEQGLAGLEQTLNEDLSSFQGAHTGDTLKLRLSLDKSLQRNILDRLRRTVIEKQARSGLVIVQDVETRHIRALSIFPSFDPNTFPLYDSNIFKNHTVSTIIEPGSIFKVLFSAYLLEQDHSIDLEEKKYFCKGHYELPNGEIINCTGEHGHVSLIDIIKYSCNAGMIEATEDLSVETLRDFLADLGVGTPSGIELPGEEFGILPHITNWGLRTKATSVIGQGVGVTPMQLINAFTTVTSDGILTQPSLIDAIETYEDTRHLSSKLKSEQTRQTIIRKQTAEKVRHLISHGVHSDSTGAAVQASGYKKVFGKTSTSQIANRRKGGYHTNRYHSLFAGGYPKDDPKFTILVVIMNPEKDYHGGRTAAPLFSEILDDVIRSYGLTDERVIEELPVDIRPQPHLQQASFLKNITLASPSNNPASPSLSNILSENNLYAVTASDRSPSYPEVISTRRVPDFSGLSLRQSLITLDRIVLENAQREYQILYQIIGNGFVTKQNPPPGTSIDDDTTIKLFFQD